MKFAGPDALRYAGAKKIWRPARPRAMMSHEGDALFEPLGYKANGPQGPVDRSS